MVSLWVLFLLLFVSLCCSPRVLIIRASVYELHYQLHVEEDANGALSCIVGRAQPLLDGVAWAGPLGKAGWRVSEADCCYARLLGWRPSLLGARTQRLQALGLTTRSNVRYERSDWTRTERSKGHRYSRLLPGSISSRASGRVAL